MQAQLHFRCGYVAIVGEPNVGKSTLLNAILGTKISIVSAKPQTTRKKILGFHNTDQHQIIFVDTPGIIQPHYLLQKSMMDATITVLNDCDSVVLMIDASKGIHPHGSSKVSPVVSKTLLDLFGSINRPILLAVNKIDLISNKNLLLPLIEKYKEAFQFHAIVPMSAMKNEGVDTLLREIEKVLPVQSPFYPQDILSEQPEKFFVSEIIREKIFDLYREEIPYSTEVAIATYEERESGKDFIAADIYVEHDSQKGILIGEKGKALKSVGVSARKDIEEFLNREVYLELHVKVREGWRDSKAHLKTLGYEVH